MQEWKREYEKSKVLDQSRIKILRNGPRYLSQAWILAAMHRDYKNMINSKRINCENPLDRNFYREIFEEDEPTFVDLNIRYLLYGVLRGITASSNKSLFLQSLEERLNSKINNLIVISKLTTSHWVLHFLLDGIDDSLTIAIHGLPQVAVGVSCSNHSVRSPRDLP